MTARSIKPSYVAIAKAYRSVSLNQSWKTPRDALVGGPAASPSSEDLDGAFRRLPHAPGERNADEGPEQRGPGVEPAEPDAVRACRPRATCVRRYRLQLGDLGLAHVPLRIDRLDQVV